MTTSYTYDGGHDFRELDNSSVVRKYVRGPETDEQPAKGGAYDQREAGAMTITVAAVYEDGVLKPEAPLDLKEKSKVTVTIETPQETKADDDDPTGWKTADQLIGFIKDGPKGPTGRDHDKYLYGAE